MGAKLAAVFAACAIVAMVSAIGASGAAAQPMTAPIDLGTIQLNSGQPAPSAPPPPLVQRQPSRPAGPPLDIKAFHGAFGGSGFVDANEADYFGMTQRDLDVRIEPSGDGGFTVAWTTVVREGGDPKTPKVRRKATSLTFVPGPRAGVYRALDNGDPLAGGTTSWASIAGRTLTVRQLSIRSDGRYDIQVYARTLSGTGMDLVYTRVVDGENRRRVRGKLVKNAN